MKVLSARANPLERIRCFALIVFAVFAVLCQGCSWNQMDEAEIEVATERLRSLYFLRDPEMGVIEGADFVRRARNAVELRAWYAVHLARERQQEEAVVEAEGLIEREPENFWSWFALAGALLQDRENAAKALAANDSAFALAPNNIHVLWQRAAVLRLSGDEELAIQMIDSLPPEIANHSAMRVQRGLAKLYAARPAGDAEGMEEAYDNFRQAIAADSNHVDAYYHLGSWLMRGMQIDEAMDVLQRATAIHPATSAHSYLWFSVQRSQNMNAEEKRAFIDADVLALLERRGETPRTLSNIAGIYRDLGDVEREREYGDRLLRRYPDGMEAEWLLTERNRAMEQDLYAAMREESPDTTQLRATYREGLEKFLAWPHHSQTSILGEAYMDLFLLVRDDSTISNDDFLDIVNGMVEYQHLNPHIVYPRGSMALAERGEQYRRAEEIARLGIEAGREEVEGNKRMGMYDSEGEYEQHLNYYTSLMRDALGWVYFNESRLDEAEQELLEAYELSNNNISVLYHLGQLNETRYDLIVDGDAEGVRLGDGEENRYLNQAEDYYTKGVMVQRPGSNPNDDALRALYIKRHGSAEGYEEFFEQSAERDRERRFARTLSERLPDPEEVLPYSLNNLDGTRVSWDDHRGKIVVINFWGTWCGPCVVEMPEFQKLHERYLSDPDVVVLTIDTDDNPDELREWMANKEFTYEVLLDDGYVGRAGINSYPTTWFIDRNGQIVFIERGSAESLAEEFGWRIEALRGGN